MPDSYSVILTTAGSPQEAESLADGLVRQKLVACAQLLPISSIYRWEGEIEKDSEVLRLDVQQGSGGYLSWISSVSAPSE